ncbi:FAD:protein FMN transferase [bacterium]|nr:FAD:protein FMN transferase [bacterium]
MSRRSDWLTGGPRAPESRPIPPAGAVTCLSREAMATLFEVQFPDVGIPRGIALLVFDEIDAIERQLSVYRPDSEVSLLNSKGHLSPQKVESRLFQLLADCHRIWAETGGAFDITAGPLIRAWGFLRREGTLPPHEELVSLLSRVGSQRLKFDLRSETILFEREGIEINLGAIGKGYAIDRAIEQLQPRGLQSALLSAGKSSIRAVGDAPGNRGWPVELSDPFLSGGRLGIVTLEDRALSTSACTEQFFEHGGKRYGHIIDPRTGWPAPPDRQVTVLADTAARAEALSTAFYVLGQDWARDYIRKDPTLGAIYVEKQDSGTACDVLGNVAW